MSSELVIHVLINQIFNLIISFDVIFINFLKLIHRYAN